MSVYATIIDNEVWSLSVNVVHDEDPIRINHGIAEWYLDLEETRLLLRNAILLGWADEAVLERVNDIIKDKIGDNG